MVKDWEVMGEIEEIFLSDRLFDDESIGLKNIRDVVLKMSYNDKPQAVGTCGEVIEQNK